MHTYKCELRIHLVLLNLHLSSLLCSHFFITKCQKRLQTQPELYGGSIIICARETYIEGGSAAFLRGSFPRLMHKVPANSLFFCFYEAFKRMLNC